MTYIKSQARTEIAKLVTTFHINEPSLEDAPEAQIESDYIRKLFQFLNWNSDNSGLSVTEWEFVLQRTDKEGKRPDYILQLDGQQLLVMDAKKVKYDMHDVRWMQQVYAYAYSTQNLPAPRKIDFAILTDFQEFVLLDCTLYAAEPKVVNKFRVLDWTCDDFVSQFDLLWELLEKENVRAAARTRGSKNPSGLWARYLSAKEVKANRIPPDKAFLAQLDDEKTGWRMQLARDMKKRNPQADGELITAAVQLLIDRLIFVKTLSDREIEDDYLAQIAEQVEKSGLAEDDAGWFNACRWIFSKLNQFYNGSVFESRPELEAVTVSNKVVRGVIRDFQPENSPYNFAVLPVEILGTIYERFLSRVVRATDLRVKIENKPNVRKDQGVYYTPQYVVDYIVEKIVGKLLSKCNSPDDVAKLKIIDPACGSGSFLLGAYAALIRWHEAYYSHKKQLTKRDREAIYQDTDGRSGRVRLKAKLKRQILVNNIFGVDLDSQAVEVTRFSLSLKALEDTRRDELANEMNLFRQTVLPDLSQNIKCGNSLIADDYSLLPLYRLVARTFDWSHEFPGIMGSGGFDAVIGNPPYSTVTDETFKQYFTSRYQTTEGRFDTFELFIEKGLGICKQEGLLGFIVPSPLLTNVYSRKLRQFILKQNSLREVTNFGMSVFADPTIHTCIVVVERKTPRNNSVRIRKQVSSIDELSIDYDYSVRQATLGNNANSTIDIFFDQATSAIAAKLHKDSTLLGDLCFIRQCIKTGNDAEFVRASATKLGGDWKPTLRGKSIGRYITSETDLYLKYGDWLARNWKNKTFYETPKIAVRETGARITATLDLDNRYFLSSLYAVYLKQSEPAPVDLKYILGIMNSALATWFVSAVAFELTKGAFTKIRTNQLARLPIRNIDLFNPNEKALHDQLVRFVEGMFVLSERKIKAHTKTEQEQVERQINTTDRQIDALVFKLYGMTQSEIIAIQQK